MYSVYLLPDKDGNWAASVNQHTANCRIAGSNTWRNLPRNLNSEYIPCVCCLKSPFFCVSIFLYTHIYIRPRTNWLRSSYNFNDGDKVNLRNFSITNKENWFWFFPSIPLISLKNLCNILKMTVHFPKFGPLLALQFFNDLYSVGIQSQTGERKQLLESLGYITTIIVSARTLEHRQKYMKQEHSLFTQEAQRKRSMFAQ